VASHGFIRLDRELERTSSMGRLRKLSPIRFATNVTVLKKEETSSKNKKIQKRTKKMTSQGDGDSSNVLSFPGSASEISVPPHVMESAVTAEGLLLMHAFLRIASSEDRRKVIALAEQLGTRDDHAARE
jgi:hypothetical protein